MSNLTQKFRFGNLNSKMEQKRVHLVISGRVQGVFFRATTKETADMLNLVGWVKNLPDGYVEAVAEGAADDIMRFIEWCGRGPRGANVTGVETEFSDPTGEFESFDIQY